MIIMIGSDHTGVTLKTLVRKHLPDVCMDIGVHRSDNPVDYPDIARDVCNGIINQDVNLSPKGVLICGTGIGMSIAANRYRSIRAALCYTPEMARLARAHNDANVLCLGARFLEPSDALAIVKVFFDTPFEGGRHEARIEALQNLGT